MKNAANASGVSESLPLDPAAQSWLQRALRFAEGRIGRTGSNPAVACLLVQNDRLVGRGRTGLGGRPHAESLALAEAGEHARGACGYVTLEPCNHHGQTEPCTEALIRAGVRRVVVGFLDPDVRVRGRGLARLRAAGVETYLARGVPLPASLRPYFFHRQHGAAYLSLKSATSLDGRIALASGESRWITNAAARRWSHGLRARVDGVMIGAETALRDQPRLDCRLSGLEDAGGRVILLDTSFRVPASFFRDKRQTVLIGSHAHFDPSLPQLAPLQQSGGLVLTCQPSELDTLGRPDLRGVLVQLAQLGLVHVLLEGGSRLAGTALQNDLPGHIYHFQSEKIIGKTGLSMIDSPALPALSGAFSDALARPPRFQLEDSVLFPPDSAQEGETLLSVWGRVSSFSENSSPASPGSPGSPSSD